MAREKRDEQRLDQVDRRSQVSVSRALRARDASRPDPEQLAQALEKLESGGPQRFKPVETPGTAAKKGPPAPEAEGAQKSPRNG